jgi:glycosyltransferase involved in cell wall biosynthesis
MQTTKTYNYIIFSLTYDYENLGGAEVAIKEIVKRVTGEGVCFDIITLNTNGVTREKLEGVTVHRIGPQIKNLYGFWGYLLKYSYSFYAFFYAYKIAKKKTINGVWSMMANYAGFAGLLFKWTHKNAHFLLTLQEGDSIEYIKKRVRFFPHIYKKIFKYADTVQVISSMLADFAKEMGFRGNVSIIPNGVDCEHFSPEAPRGERLTIRQKFNIHMDTKLIITTSRLVKKNAIHTIINALAFLSPKYQLLIVGQGPLEHDLRFLAEKRGVNKRIAWSGFQKHEELPQLLRSADVFARPSLSEGLGNSFLEAMACGIPVIATPVGGIVDFIEDKKTGYFCAIENPKDLADVILTISRNTEESDRVRSNALALIRNTYTWDRIAIQMKELFKHENK